MIRSRNLAEIGPVKMRAARALFLVAKCSALWIVCAYAASCWVFQAHGDDGREEEAKLVSEILEHQFYIAYFGAALDRNMTTSEDRWKLIKWPNEVPVVAHMAGLSEQQENQATLVIGNTVKELESLGVAISHLSGDTTSGAARIHFFSSEDKVSILNLRAQLATHPENSEEFVDFALEHSTKYGCYAAIDVGSVGDIVSALSMIRSDRSSVVFDACIKQSIMAMIGFRGGSLLLGENSIFNFVDPSKVEFNWLDRLVIRLYSDPRLVPGLMISTNKSIIRAIAKEMVVNMQDLHERYESLQR